MTEVPAGAVLRVIDLETTGQGFADGGVVEVGWQDLARDAGGAWALRGGPGARLVRPEHPISAQTSAIHHIVDEDVAGAAPWQEVAPEVLQPAPAPLALVAHRASFEQRWCRPQMSGGARWICTYKCALRLWPDSPTHSNQGLRYARRPAGLDRETGLPAHRAGPDAYVTAFHVRDMLAVADVEQLLAWSDEPALLVKVPFGPWRGRRWGELGEDALEQILAGGAGSNVDMAFTARMERARRDGAVAVAPVQSALGL